MNYDLDLRTGKTALWKKPWIWIVVCAIILGLGIFLSIYLKKDET